MKNLCSLGSVETGVSHAIRFAHLAPDTAAPTREAAIADRGPTVGGSLKVCGSAASN